MNRRARWTLGGLAFVLALVLLLPAAADWLVTREGDRIETDGPWRVEDRLIVFKHKNGTLSSIRRSSVDLEASERLTREMAERARNPEPAPQPAVRKAKIRLTEKELPPAGPLAEPPAADGEAEGARTREDETVDESLQITSWNEVAGSGGSGMAFLGEVRNVTDRTALGVGVEVTLYDEEGETIASAPAALTTTALPPHQSARFRASFPDVYQYTRVDFRSAGTLVDSGGSSDDDATAANPDGDSGGDS